MPSTSPGIDESPQAHAARLRLSQSMRNGGAKHGLKLLGRLDEEVRLPLMKVTPPTGKVIRDAMVHAGLMN